MNIIRKVMHGNERLYQIFKNSWYWTFFCLELGPYRFCLNPDPYQSSVWIRIRNEFFSYPESGSGLHFLTYLLYVNSKNKTE